jgi:hypothetical protein
MSVPEMNRIGIIRVKNEFQLPRVPRVIYRTISRIIVSRITRCNEKNECGLRFRCNLYENMREPDL